MKGKLRILARIEYHLVQKSFFFNTINRRIRRLPGNNNKQKNTRQIDIQTFVGVVDKTKSLLAEKYQGIEFHVIFWDEKDNDYSKDILDALEGKDIKTHRVSSILKDDFWTDDANLYRVLHDGHPSPLMHKIMAKYVVNEIIGRNIE
jgi:hypothetical protein